MAAADVVLLASGTATLEATLLKKPMVVGYRIANMTYSIARRMVKLKYFSLPNLLARQARVPEFIQADMRAELIAPEVVRLFSDQQARQEQIEEFAHIHKQLRCNASLKAANAISDHFHLFQRKNI